MKTTYNFGGMKHNTWSKWYKIPKIDYNVKM